MAVCRLVVVTTIRSIISLNVMHHSTTHTPGWQPILCNNLFWIASVLQCWSPIHSLTHSSSYTSCNSIPLKRNVIKSNKKLKHSIKATRRVNYKFISFFFHCCTSTLHCSSLTRLRLELSIALSLLMTRRALHFTLWPQAQPHQTH